jgi:hypothetical protein
VIEFAWMESKKHPNWGGKRVPGPGKKLGRGGDRTFEWISCRLDPWLITQLGLKRKANTTGSDYQALKKYAFKGLEYLLAAKAGGDRTYANLKPARSLNGCNRRGWEQKYTSFTPSFVGDEIKRLNLVKKKDESLSQLLARLVTIAAATEGKSRLFEDITLEDIPMREEYQSGAVKPVGDARKQVDAEVEKTTEKPVMKLSTPRRTRVPSTKTKAPRQRQR